MNELYGVSLKQMNKEEIKKVYGNGVNAEVEADSILFTISIAFSGGVASFLGSYFVSHVAKCGNPPPIGRV